jgi:hypothetical protein
MNSTKPILRINLDETSVSHFHGYGRGLLACRYDEQGKRIRPTQKVKHAYLRTYLTYVACFCDNSDVQQVLPQFIIGGEKTILVRLKPFIPGILPPNWTVIRSKNHWNNADIMISIIHWIGVALLPFRDAFQPVLYMDCFRAHFQESVIAACRDAGIWIAMIPPKLTPLLQPLDASIFALFEKTLAERYRRLKVANVDGFIGTVDLMRVIIAASEEVLKGRAWGHAFARVGFGNGQRFLNRSLMRELQIEVPPIVCTIERPHGVAFKSMFPRRAIISESVFYSPFDRHGYG